MNFTTSVDIPKTSLSITHQQRLMLLGSCFADSIGQKLLREKYQCLVNPFGTLYNPASIAALLLRSISEQEYTAQSPEIFTAKQLSCRIGRRTGYKVEQNHALRGRMAEKL